MGAAAATLAWLSMHARAHRDLAEVSHVMEMELLAELMCAAMLQFASFTLG